MGISRFEKKIRPTLRKLAAVSTAAGFVFAAFAAGKPADPPATPSPSPTPEPTEIPRPDVLNIKKRSSADVLLEQDWLKLTLMKPDDVPGTRQVPEYSDASLRKRISQGFGLPAVMTMRDPLRSPPQWWTPESKGTESLTLGPTRHFDRPELNIEMPMLRMREIPYLMGESDFIRETNEVVRIWSLGRIEQAAKMRDKLQKDKKKIPRGSVERTAVAILNGFLDLQVALLAEQPLAYYGPALGSMWDALGFTETRMYLAADGKNKIDKRLFDASLAEPAMFTNEGVWPPMLTPPNLSPRSVELVPFIRTMALPVIFNVAALSVKAKNWMRVYEATQKFDEIYALLDPTFTKADNSEIKFTSPPGVAASHALLMRPATPHQLKILMQMMRVKAQFKAEDPLLALRETAKVILNSDVPSFKTIGFSFAGRIYDELGYPNYARRFFSFAEAFADSSWYQQNPYFLLGGAENAFWSGDYAIAKKSFEKFLLAAGDKVYGPWARLRLAEITHLQQGPEKATILYESLLRSQPLHPAGLIARRRLFCINAPTTGARARHQEYMALKDMTTQFDLDEMEQIRACHINGLMDDLAKMSTQSVKSLPEESGLQLSLIEEFKEKYPYSGYLKFFESRAVSLQAAMGPYYLAFKQCSSALEFVRKNETKIATLKANSGKFLETLRWTQEEQERLVRCAALFSSAETLEKIQKEKSKLDNAEMRRKAKSSARKSRPLKDNESPDQRLVRLTVAMAGKPSDRTASELLTELRRRGRFTLGEDVKKLEEQQSESIDDPDFWVKLAKLRVMRWDLEQPANKKPLLNRQLRAEVLRRPDQTLKNEEFCQRFLLESASLSKKEWDSFVLAVPTSEWLRMAELGSEECVRQITGEALRSAQMIPSPARDRHLLWPWLKARGAKQEQEAWLALGQRWDQQGIVSKQEVEDLFKTLEQQADNPVVKQAAKAWRESRKPSGLW